MTDAVQESLSRTALAALVVTRDEATRQLGGIDQWEYSSSLLKFEQLYGLLRQ